MLIVDDNVLILELLRQLLEDDYVLTTASNGKLALEAVKAHRPELIVMDLTMPVMDGWTAIAALRADPITRRIPIIALSAVGEERDVQRAISAGADCHLHKPVDEALLVQHIERLLTISRALHSSSMQHATAAVADRLRKRT